MCDASTIVGLGYKFPTYEELQRKIIQVKKNDIDTRLDDLKKSWDTIGYMVMSIGWIDLEGRTVLNLLVHCPKGTMFIKYATLLCELMDGFI
jgi:hypothetical protein